MTISHDPIRLDERPDLYAAWRQWQQSQERRDGS